MVVHRSPSPALVSFGGLKLVAGHSYELQLARSFRNESFSRFPQGHHDSRSRSTLCARCVPRVPQRRICHGQLPGRSWALTTAESNPFLQHVVAKSTVLQVTCEMSTAQCDTDTMRLISLPRCWNVGNSQFPARSSRGQAGRPLDQEAQTLELSRTAWSGSFPLARRFAVPVAEPVLMEAEVTEAHWLRGGRCSYKCRHAALHSWDEQQVTLTLVEERGVSNDTPKMAPKVILVVSTLFGPIWSHLNLLKAYYKFSSTDRRNGSLNNWYNKKGVWCHLLCVIL